MRGHRQWPRRNLQPGRRPQNPPAQPGRRRPPPAHRVARSRRSLLPPGQCPPRNTCRVAGQSPVRAPSQHRRLSGPRQWHGSRPADAPRRYSTAACGQPGRASIRSSADARTPEDRPVARCRRNASPGGGSSAEAPGNRGWTGRSLPSGQGRRPSRQRTRSSDQYAQSPSSPAEFVSAPGHAWGSASSTCAGAGRHLRRRQAHHSGEPASPCHDRCRAAPGPCLQGFAGRRGCEIVPRQSRAQSRCPWAGPGPAEYYLRTIRSRANAEFYDE